MNQSEKPAEAMLPTIDACGILNIDKPSGMTSRDVVNRVVRAGGKIKAGHAGTLDPLASGVLVLCVGTATRLIEYVQRMPKAYHGTFLLGQSSASDDVESELVPLADPPQPTREEIEKAMPQFRGHIEQRPPAFSAIKIKGQRAYKLARRGEEVDIPPRPVRVDAFEIVEYEYPNLVVDIRCGSGTYVRSLGRDLAKAVGSAAVMSALVRTEIGSFSVENASKLDDIRPETFSDHLMSPLLALEGLPQTVLDPREIEEVRHGRLVDCDSSAEELVAVDGSGQLVAIMVARSAAKYGPGKFGPKVNFVR